MHPSLHECNGPKMNGPLLPYLQSGSESGCRAVDDISAPQASGPSLVQSRSCLVNNLSANFCLQIPSSFHISHCLPFSRMPDRCTSLLDEASFPPSTHHDPSPARSGGAPPSRHDAEEPGGRAPSSQTQKNHRHKIHRTQHCSHQFGRPPMLLTLWEKYAGLKLKPKGSFCGSFGWAVKLC